MGREILSRPVLSSPQQGSTFCRLRWGAEPSGPPGHHPLARASLLGQSCCPGPGPTVGMRCASFTASQGLFLVTSSLCVRQNSNMCPALTRDFQPKESSRGAGVIPAYRKPSRVPEHQEVHTPFLVRG